MTISTRSYKTRKRLAQEEKILRQARRNFTTYKHLIYRPYHHAPHLEILDRALEQLARYVETEGREGIGRLIIEMPPRHSKTLSTSKLFPGWFLGNQPNCRVMLISYGHTLAFRNSRFARNAIRSPIYRAIFPGIALSDDSAAVDSWELDGHEGGCDASGITGGVAGKGAHILVIDDPIKNRAEAESKVYREAVWDAYTNDLYTRLEPGGAIIIMMTRWHQDDLIGRVLAQEDDPDADDREHWIRIRMPALIETDDDRRDDPLGREFGEALWPWRYPVERLRKVAKAVGRYVWAALYEQRPQPREGGLFRWDDIDGHRVRSGPDLMRIGVAVDPTGSAEGDECGIVAGGIARDGHIYILADRSLHASSAQWARAAVQAYHDYKADRMVAEKNFGGDMVETVIRTVDKHISFKLVTATRGKELRAEPVSALYEQGMVHHVGEFAPLEDEMTTWRPGGPSPNRLDALVWLVTELALANALSSQRVAVKGYGQR